MLGRIGEKEKEYVLEVLNTEFRSSKGADFMRRLEEEFCKKYNVKHAISFVNGTATMHAALEALGVGEGDEVIVPPLTMSATTFAVLQANATPIFADVDADTFNIDPKSIKERITDRTRVIITVALYGLSPEMSSIRELASKKGIKIIEDNAECFLGTYQNDWAGKFGDCASFSFQSSKHLTSGEGGMIITDNTELATKIRQVQSLGYAGVGASKAKISKQDIQNPNYNRHISMGWNYRMPELCCAVALAQVERIEELVKRRIEVAEIFTDHTREYNDWFTPQKVPGDCQHSYWTWVCINKNTSIDWCKLRDKFLSLGGDNIYAAWKLTYHEPMIVNMDLLKREKYLNKSAKKNYRLGSCPIAENLQPNLFQFKTNYWDPKLDKVYKQAEILNKTLKYFK